jgi:hypothetical protein
MIEISGWHLVSMSTMKFLIYPMNHSLIVHPTWPIFKHSKHIHVLWASVWLTTEGNPMVIPGVHPFRKVLIDSIQEQPVKQPDVGFIFWVKAMIALQICKEKFPFPSNTLTVITPKTL